MRIPTLLLFLFLLFACDTDANRQYIDMSDSVVDRPVDGIGHYVYALTIPKEIKAGEKFNAEMEWRTVGSVDPKASYTMDILLSGPAEKTYSIAADANTVGELHLTNWLSYAFDVPENFPAGTYNFSVRLRNDNQDFERVPLGYKEELALKDGFYRLAKLQVVD